MNNTGTVIRVNDNPNPRLRFFFIQPDPNPDPQPDLYAHASSFEGLAEVGQRLSFDTVETPRGRAARNCVLCEDQDKGREHGTLASLGETFGFIVSEFGDERLWVHASELRGEIAVGEKLSYSVGKDRRGRPRAIAVRRES